MSRSTSRILWLAFGASLVSAQVFGADEVTTVAAESPPSPAPSAPAPAESGEGAGEGVAPSAEPSTESGVVEEPPPVTEVTTTSEPAAETYAPEPPLASREPWSPFAQNSIRLGLGLGWVSSGYDNWVLVGLGLGYFVLPGLEAHADATFWIGDPFVTTLTPGLRYVFHMVPDVKPYVGAFYRHYFVSAAGRDTDSVGGRAGVYFMLTPTSYLGGGAVYEHFLDTNLFTQVDTVYPELSFALAF